MFQTHGLSTEPCPLHVSYLNKGTPPAMQLDKNLYMRSYNRKWPRLVIVIGLLTKAHTKPLWRDTHSTSAYTGLPPRKPLKKNSQSKLQNTQTLHHEQGSVDTGIKNSPLLPSLLPRISGTRTMRTKIKMFTKTNGVKWILKTWGKNNKYFKSQILQEPHKASSN